MCIFPICPGFLPLSMLINTFNIQKFEILCLSETLTVQSCTIFVLLLQHYACNPRIFVILSWKRLQHLKQSRILGFEIPANWNHVTRYSYTMCATGKGFFLLHSSSSPQFPSSLLVNKYFYYMKVCQSKIRYQVKYNKKAIVSCLMSSCM